MNSLQGCTGEEERNNFQLTKEGKESFPGGTKEKKILGDAAGEIQEEINLSYKVQKTKKPLQRGTVL